MPNALDNPGREEEIRSTIERKPFLKKLYRETYEKYRICLERCPTKGVVLEFGAGCGFAKEVVEELVTSDITAYKGVDRCIDATKLPFENRSLRAIFLYNTFHHIPDAEAFLREADRCLISGGRIFMVEPYMGWISTVIYKYMHHEHFDADTMNWKFESSGPVSDANSPLACIVFDRDLKIFCQKFPDLKLEAYLPHTPLRFWLAGGLKRWSLLPGWMFSTASRLDSLLIQISPKLGSFMDIEVRKR